MRTLTETERNDIATVLNSTSIAEIDPIGVQYAGKVMLAHVNNDQQEYEINNLIVDTLANIAVLKGFE